MFKYFSANSTRKHIDSLDKLLDQYNSTIHSSIGMTPKEASKKRNEAKVWHNLYGDFRAVKHKAQKFKVGDQVRITKKKGIFEKGYTPRWTEEVFTISEIRYTDPITYKIVDCNNEEIKGTFYEPELQKATQELFRVEKIIKKKR